MEMIGLKVLMQRNSESTRLEFIVPDWIAARIGDLFFLEYDGVRLSLWPADSED
jgi:hypothetical protein